jgi:hypothetical protein
MAVIRIIDLPENSKSLIDELRARGFTIATGSQDSGAAADLELSLEECSVEEALEKCEQTEGPPAMIFIAPGAVDEAWRPIIAVPLIPNESFPEEEALKPSFAEYGRLEPAVAIERVAQEVDVAPEITAALSQDAVPAQDLEIAHASQQMPAGLPVNEPANVTSDQQAEPFEVRAVPVEAVIADHVGVLQSSVVAQQSAPPIEQVTEPTEVHQVSDWPIWNPLSEPEFEMEAARDDQQSHGASVSSAAARSQVARWSSLRWDEKFFWKAAPVAAALALAGFFATTLAHRVSPLPPAISQAEEQNQRPPLERAHDVHDARLQKVSAGSALLPDPIVGRHDSLSASETVSAASKRQRIGAVRPRETRPETDLVARDTVVRHSAKKTAPEPSHKSAEAISRSSGVRYYSDLPKAPR